MTLQRVASPEYALRESNRMRILASQYRQMGFRELSRWMRKNADAALRWAVDLSADSV